MIIERFSQNPIITPHMDRRMGVNVNGPSLIRVPPWLPDALGRYYLYFAAHGGLYIRLAYANTLQGPWQIYSPGTLRLSETPCVHHIASPDVHVDHEHREIRMYFHGPTEAGKQCSFVATSTDGLHFVARREVLGDSYFRAFTWQDRWYALAMPGILYRSADGLSDFEKGPTIFAPSMRHSAVLVRGHKLAVFFTRVGDCPESILYTTVDLRSDWFAWRPEDPVIVLKPEMAYEGAELPLRPSERGPAPGPVRQLRDPCLYCEEGRTFLLYAVAGESGIAIAEIKSW